MGLLKWTLHHRAATLLLDFAIFAGLIYSGTLLPTTIVRAADAGRLTISVQLPPGATLDETRTLTNALSLEIKIVEDVHDVFVRGGITDIATAKITGTFGDKASRSRLSFEIEDQIKTMLAAAPDSRVNFLAGNGQRDVTIAVPGENIDQVNAAAAKLAEQMRGVSDITNVINDEVLARPELRIVPKPQVAAEPRVTASDLAWTILMLTVGDTGANLDKFSIDGRQIPVTVSMAESGRRNLEVLQSQRIPTATAAPVPLDVVADITLSTGPSSIERHDHEAKVTLETDLAKGAALGLALKKINALFAATDTPAEVMGQVFASFGAAMGAGILLVYVVLVLQFGSFVTPLTILMSLPWSIDDAILARYVTGNAIGLSLILVPSRILVINVLKDRGCSFLRLGLGSNAPAGG